MKWYRDVLRQCVYMSFFIIPIPIGAYTIHNGSSAFAALASYLFLSIFIPWAYLGFSEARFGEAQLPISRKWFIFMWFVMRFLNVAMGSCGENTVFWEWPTIGRDVVFIVVMYMEISCSMLAAYVLTRLMGRKPLSDSAN